VPFTVANGWAFLEEIASRIGIQAESIDWQGSSLREGAHCGFFITEAQARYNSR